MKYFSVFTKDGRVDLPIRDEQAREAAAIVKNPLTDVADKVRELADLSNKLTKVQGLAAGNAVEKIVFKDVDGREMVIDKAWSDAAREASAEARRARAGVKGKSTEDRMSPMGKPYSQHSDDELETMRQEISNRSNARGGKEYLTKPEQDIHTNVHEEIERRESAGGPEARHARDVENAKQAILRDVKAGVVPKDVKTFSELHDHVDANAYLNPDFRQEYTPGNLTRWNRISDDVDKWINDGMPRTDSVKGEVKIDFGKAWSEEARAAALEARKARAKTSLQDEHINFIDRNPNLSEDALDELADRESKGKTPTDKKAKWQLGANERAAYGGLSNQQKQDYIGHRNSGRTHSEAVSRAQKYKDRDLGKAWTDEARAASAAARASHAQESLDQHDSLHTMEQAGRYNDARAAGKTHEESLASAGADPKDLVRPPSATKTPGVGRSRGDASVRMPIAVQQFRQKNEITAKNYARMNVPFKYKPAVQAYIDSNEFHEDVERHARSLDAEVNSKGYAQGPHPTVRAVQEYMKHVTAKVDAARDLVKGGPGPGNKVEKAWSDEAREASAEARRNRAGGKRLSATGEQLYSAENVKPKGRLVSEKEVIARSEFRAQHAAQTWKNWQDDQLERVVHNPVGKDGTPLHPSLVEHAKYEIGQRAGATGVKSEIIGGRKYLTSVSAKTGRPMVQDPETKTWVWRDNTDLDEQARAGNEKRIRESLDEKVRLMAERKAQRGGKSGSKLRDKLKDFGYTGKAPHNMEDGPK